MTLFEREEEENYYKPVGVSNFWNNNYIEFESNDDRNKTLSVEEYLNKIRPYLNHITSNLKKSDTWKIQLVIGNKARKPKVPSLSLDATYVQRWAFCSNLPANV